DNQVRLQLFALAYNLANFLRQLALPRPGADLDADDAAGEADQDRREGGAPCPGGDVPVGGGGSPASVVRGHPGSVRSVEGGTSAGLRAIVGRGRRSHASEGGDDAPRSPGTAFGDESRRAVPPVLEMARGLIACCSVARP